MSHAAWETYLRYFLWYDRPILTQSNLNIHYKSQQKKSFFIQFLYSTPVQFIIDILNLLLNYHYLTCYAAQKS